MRWACIGQLSAIIAVSGDCTTETAVALAGRRARVQVGSRAPRLRRERRRPQYTSQRDHGPSWGNLHGAGRRSDTGEDRRMAWIASLEASSGDSAITVAGRSKRWSACARGSARSVP